MTRTVVVLSSLLAITLSIGLVSMVSRKPPHTPHPVTDLRTPRLKELAMQLVASAENSTLNWRAQYGYLEDIGDGRGYTGGIIGFCSGTGDLLDVITRYTKLRPDNPLANYQPALRRVIGTASHQGLGPRFEQAWQQAAADPHFRTAQDMIRDEQYFEPAVSRARGDGLRALGQFIYYDAMVMHGPGSDDTSFEGLRQAALRQAKSPAQGGSETAYLRAFLVARKAVMQREDAHSDTSRLDHAQAKFLREGNLDLTPPLTWEVYGDPYRITHW